MRIALVAALAVLAVPTAAAAQATPPSPGYEQTIEIPQPPARSWLGLAMQQESRVEWGLASMDAPVVTRVEPGSPADAAGLRGGDAILAIDGCDLQTVCVNWRQLVPGQAYRLRVRRDGEERDATLVPAPPRPRPTDG